MTQTTRVAVIGAGIGGLVAAIDLARRGADVVVLERAATPGGKMRQVGVGGAMLDAGPTVFTMRQVFDAIFAEAGASLEDMVTLRPASVLARHAWADGARLDLFADRGQSQDAIGAFAGAAASRGYGRFCARAERAFTVLDAGFMQQAHPSIAKLLRSSGVRGAATLVGLAPWASLWQRLGQDFPHPRLRQLFARYATYCGASPFLAPATLMLIAHVERQGVWLIEGGMHRLAQALASLATALGTRFRYNSHVREIVVANGAPQAVVLASKERIEIDAVVVNADTAALASGLLGAAAAQAVPRPPMGRSLSALTWALHASVSGFPLHRHNVFFAPDYAAEFRDIFAHGRLPQAPTVYVCAQDRGETDQAPAAGPERLFCLVNAPALGDTRPFTPSEIAQCEERVFRLLATCGLTIHRPAPCQVTTPSDFAALFPATGGALYGPAIHGPMAAFRRPTAQTRMRGLYLAGGSVHPGAGVPMAALSGRMAAAQLLADFASTGRFHPVATPGGMSMRLARMAPTASL